MASKFSDRDQYLKIGRPRDTCLLCQSPLNVDGRHPSLLEMGDREEAVRKDFCAKCWGSMGEQGYFSFWVTKRVNAPSAAERRLARSERNDALWRLFAALYGQKDAAVDLAPQLFLLAHLLLRYKVLQFAGVQEGRLRFVHPKLEESFLIADVAIDQVDFSKIKAEVEEQALEFVGETDEEEGKGEG